MIRRIALSSMLLLAACGVSQAGEPMVTLDEFSVAAAEALAAGPIDLVVTNAGDFGHTLVVTDEAGEVLAVTELIEPGGVETVRADLDPGRYQFSCRIVVETPDGSISDHYELGMVTAVVVPGSG